ncbi:hypothetical protein VTJ49DRAFT_857 [Mycothermus thermophilus]|uniref:histone acetyltransferase n=1 Tax=Humicola insolens TaxID=85995 RepID=A0ABR3VPT8_HUMIN
MPANLKRKRPDRDQESLAARTKTVADTSQSGVSGPRRTTRQTSSAPLPAPEPPRRRRRIDSETPGESTENPPPRPQARSPRGKENIPVQGEQQQQEQPGQQHGRGHHAKPTTRSTRLTAAAQDAPAAPRAADVNSRSAASPVPVSPAQTIPVAPPDTHRPAAASRTAPPTTTTTGGRQRSGSRPLAFEAFVPPQQSVSLGRNKPIFMATSTAQQQPAQATNANGPPNSPARKPDGASRPDRNIDKVVLGDICFRAWYPSYYGKEVLGDFAGGKMKGGKASKSHGQDARDDSNDTRPHGKRDRETPMLDRLCVCPCCFKYSKELVTWWEHVRWCERRNVIPGKKIYTHPKGSRTILVPSGPAQKQGRGKRGSVGQKMVEEVVQDEGEWSIWEVDGEKEVLFCQNLSLFAKLFLDNKSVFFDVTGFNYFLLVYTPPARSADTAQPRSQIVGFFSKEKISWDNNNLACILIFPPWQRKGLGSLLMGISYEISRREGLLGGPEKPISDLGKKGYRRFWAGEIARYLLSLRPDMLLSNSTSTSTGDETDTTTTTAATDEIVIDIDRISQATWIVPEDCLLVLREMGVAEDAGTGPGPRPTTPAQKAHDPTTTTTTTTTAGTSATTSATKPDDHTNVAGGANASSGDASTEDQSASAPVVQRVRISQAAVGAWVAANKIPLERACDPDGFVEGYAIKSNGAGAGAGAAETAAVVAGDDRD